MRYWVLKKVNWEAMKIGVLYSSVCFLLFRCVLETIILSSHGTLCNAALACP